MPSRFNDDKNSGEGGGNGKAVGDFEDMLTSGVPATGVDGNSMVAD